MSIQSCVPAKKLKSYSWVAYDCFFCTVCHFETQKIWFGFSQIRLSKIYLSHLSLGCHDCWTSVTVASMLNRYLLNMRFQLKGGTLSLPQLAPVQRSKDF